MEFWRYEAILRNISAGIFGNDEGAFAINHGLMTRVEVRVRGNVLSAEKEGLEPIPGVISQSKGLGNRYQNDGKWQCIWCQRKRYIGKRWK